MPGTLPAPRAQQRVFEVLEQTPSSFCHITRRHTSCTALRSLTTPCLLHLAVLWHGNPSLFLVAQWLISATAPLRVLFTGPQPTQVFGTGTDFTQTR